MKIDICPDLYVVVHGDLKPCPILPNLFLTEKEAKASIFVPGHSCPQKWKTPHQVVRFIEPFPLRRGQKVAE